MIDILPIISCPMGPSDPTNWIIAISTAVAALGTVGAFLVAIWVATRDKVIADDPALPGDVTRLGRLLRSAVRLLRKRDAQRYAREWGAHLRQLEDDGEHERAQRDRRRLALRAVRLAIELRLRALLRWIWRWRMR